MRQYDLALDKYWVTYSGYFRLTTTVVLGMSSTDGKILFYHDISEVSVDKNIQLESTTIGRFMTASRIPFQIIVVAHI